MKFSIGIHNHQPVGNFDYVVEDAYQRSYWPFLQTFARFPKLSLTLHNSGPIWDFVAVRHPEYMELVKQLVKDGRLELLTGTYYEAILPSIPDCDKVGQIRKMTDFLDDNFGAVPRGMWLAERVWEPHLPRSLADAGVRYCILDDTHFRRAGLREEQLCGYFLTEEQGATVAVVPINRALRMAIPFEPVSRVAEILAEFSRTWPDGFVLFADDGEKFGVWPETYERVYKGGWLEDFFTRLTRVAETVPTVTLAAAMARPAAGRVYLPTSSYPEMNTWALPPREQRVLDRLTKKLTFEGTLGRYEEFISGTTWRSFLTRYPEANRLHKKMLHVSRAVALSPAAGPEIRDMLWQAQCNCAYWHGVFGGLHLPHLRGALYSKLIEAEAALDRLHPERHGLFTQDIDADGHAEILVSTKELGAVFAPASGGAVYGIDYKPRNVNLTDTLARRLEAYHEDGSHVYDAHPCDCFLDHFYEPGAEPEDAVDLGDFATGIYHLAETTPKQHQVVLTREGTVKHQGVPQPVRVEKRLTVGTERAEIRAVYRITATGPTRFPIQLGVEFNFGMLAGNTPEERYVVIDGAMPKLRELGAREGHPDARVTDVFDTWRKLKVRLSTSSPATVWRFPVETACRSVFGGERIFQSICLIPAWDLELTPGEAITLEIGLTVEGLA